jgi:hypothetical protein
MLVVAFLSVLSLGSSSPLWIQCHGTPEYGVGRIVSVAVTVMVVSAICTGIHSVNEGTCVIIVIVIVTVIVTVEERVTVRVVVVVVVLGVSSSSVGGRSTPARASLLQ